MPTIPSVVSAFCDMLRTHTGAGVQLGRPDHGEDGIYVWPWNLYQDPHPRTLPSDDRHSKLLDAPVLELLVFVRPDSTIDGLTRLDEARIAIREHPVLDIDGSTVRVTVDYNGNSELQSIFSAACLPMTICIPVNLGWSDPDEPNSQGG